MKFIWTTITVKNMEESIGFYTEVVGLTVERRMNPTPGTEIAFLGPNETKVELIRHEQNDTPRHGSDISLGFEVDSLDAHIEALKERGITDIQGPIQPNPMVRFIYIRDPNGVKIQFVENTRD